MISQLDELNTDCIRARHDEGISGRRAGNIPPRLATWMTGAIS